jgi:hypothetical protein
MAAFLKSDLDAQIEAGVTPNIYASPNVGTLKTVLHNMNTADFPLAGPVSGLPIGPAEGMLMPVTDATVTTVSTVVVGGGSNHVLVYYNGTAWKIIGS